MHKRFHTIDVMRGITIALMIFVNVSGLSESYAFFTHAPWNGCTLADWVFPSFLFIVGFSIGLAKTKDTKGIVKRVVILFICGLAINFYFRPDITHVRILGVLQRIAICYGVVALLAYRTKPVTQAILVFFILVAYWLLLHFYSASLVSSVDILILKRHMYTATFEPEGLLSTFPAIAQTLLGLLTYHLFTSIKSPSRRILVCVSLGILLCAVAIGWDGSFPINKSLWSSSYVLWTTGLSLFFLAGVYVCVDLYAFNGLDWFKIMGQQALLLYVLHMVFIKWQLKHAAAVSTWSGLSIQDATLLYALASTLFFVGVSRVLHMKYRPHSKMRLLS